MSFSSSASFALRARIYERANLVTGLTAVGIISLSMALIAHEPGGTIFPFILPIVSLVGLVVCVATKNVKSFVWNFSCYVIIAMLASVAVMSSLPFSPTGIIPTVWMASIIAGVFAVLSLTYFVKSSVNRHTLAMFTAIINVFGTACILSLNTFMVSTDNFDLANVIIRGNVISFVLSLVFSAVIVFLYSRAYKYSFAARKIFAPDWFKKDDEQELKHIKKVAEKNGFEFREFVSTSRKASYIFKGDQSIVLIPVEESFGEKDMTKKLPKNAGVRAGTFDKVVASVVYQFGAVYQLPKVPMLIVFVTTGDKLHRIVRHELARGAFAESVLFVPHERLKEWLTDISSDRDDAEHRAFFPELTDKQKIQREQFFEDDNNEKKRRKPAKSSPSKSSNSAMVPASDTA